MQRVVFFFSFLFLLFVNHSSTWLFKFVNKLSGRNHSTYRIIYIYTFLQFDNCFEYFVQFNCSPYFINIIFYTRVIRNAFGPRNGSRIPWHTFHYPLSVCNSNYEFQFRILIVKLVEKKILNFPSANVHFN